MFYGKESNYANLNELEQAIKDYIHFYNYERTKAKLKGLTNSISESILELHNINIVSRRVTTNAKRIYFIITKERLKRQQSYYFLVY